MTATHIEHRFIPAKMQAVEEPVACAKFPIIAAAHQQERFAEENDAAIKHRITDADQRSDISGRRPCEREISHRKQRGAAEQKSADKARSVQSVIRFFLSHSIALEGDSSRKHSQLLVGLPDNRFSPDFRFFGSMHGWDSEAPSYNISRRSYL